MIYAKSYVSKTDLVKHSAPLSTLSSGAKAIEHFNLVTALEKGISSKWSILRRRNIIYGQDMVSATDLAFSNNSIAVMNSYGGHNVLKMTTGIVVTRVPHPVGLVLDMYQSTRRTYSFDLESWIASTLEWAKESLGNNEKKLQLLHSRKLQQFEVDHIIMEASRGSRLHKLSWRHLSKVQTIYHNIGGTTAYDLAVAFATAARCVSPILQFHAGYQFTQILLEKIKKSRKTA